MKIMLNGKSHEVGEGTTLGAFLDNLGIAPQGVAVAINYEVVPKDAWNDTVLTDGVELMLITAVSGG